MDMRDALHRLRELMADVTGIQHVYGAGNNDAYAMPEAVNNTPAVLVYPRQLVEYRQYPGGGHRHTYNLAAQILAGPAGSPASVYESVPYIEGVIDKMAGNITMGERVNSIRLVAATWGNLEFGGATYIGWDLTFEVTEHAAVTFAGGSQS